MQPPINSAFVCILHGEQETPSIFLNHQNQHSDTPFPRREGLLIRPTSEDYGPGLVLQVSATRCVTAERFTLRHEIPSSTSPQSHIINPSLAHVDTGDTIHGHNLEQSYGLWIFSNVDAHGIWILREARAVRDSRERRFGQSFAGHGQRHIANVIAEMR